MDTENIKEVLRRNMACTDRNRNLILIGIIFIVVAMLIRSHQHQHKEIKYLQDSLSNFYNDFDPADIKDMNSLKDFIKKTSEKLLKPNVGINELNEASDRAGSRLQTLQNFYHDKTGRPDLALGVSGGRIAGIGENTEPLYSCNAFWRILGCPNKISGPEKIIEKSMEPGECFRFKGQKATVFIRLVADAFLDSAAIEHITPQLSLTGDISSAPRVFNVSVSFNQSSHEMEINV